MAMPQRTRRDLSRFRLALRDHSERVNYYADWYKGRVWTSHHFGWYVLPVLVGGGWRHYSDHRHDLLLSVISAVRDLFL